MRRRLEFALGFLLSSVANVCGQEIAPESQPQANPPARIIDENAGLRNIIYNLSAIDYIPFSLSVNQSTSFSDNVQGLPQGTPSPGIPSRGDIISATNFAGSSKVYLGEQLLFANAGYGLTRYVRDFQLNANNDFRDAGVKWTLTPRCSGDLVAAMVSSQSSALGPPSPGQINPQSPVQGPPPLGQSTVSAIFPGQVNTVSTKAADERARCQVSGHISAILDSGWGLITNSFASSATSNSSPSSSATPNPFATSNRLQRYVRGGLEYEVADLNTLGLQTTFIDRDFLGRSPSATPGLAEVIKQTNYELSYRRLFGPSIEFKATVGLADIIGIYTPQIPPIHPTASRLEFIYTASLHYAATPKINFDLLASHSVDAPAGGATDLAIADAQSLSLSYAFSPVLSFSGTISRGVLNSPTLMPIPPPPPGTPPTTSLLFLNSTTKAGTVSASYRLSPFVNATASYSFTQQEGLAPSSNTGSSTAPRANAGSQRATSNVFLLGLSYAGHDFFTDGLSGRPTPP